MNPRGEKFVTYMMMGGCVTALVGGFLFALVFIAGLGRMANTHGSDVNELLLAGVFLVLALAGFGMMGYGLVSGFRFNSAAERGGSRHEPDVVVGSRFAINELGEMIFSNFEYDAPGGKLYVQLRFPDGHVEELRTAWGVFSQCGEGMKGAAMLKGTWLSSFAPIITQSEPLRDPDF